MSNSESQQRKDAAMPLTNEIMHALQYHLRYKMGVWPKEADFLEIKRFVKSLVVQHMFYRKQNEDN